MKNTMTKIIVAVFALGVMSSCKNAKNELVAGASFYAGVKQEEKEAYAEAGLFDHRIRVIAKYIAPGEAPINTDGADPSVEFPKVEDEEVVEVEVAK